MANAFMQIYKKKSGYIYYFTPADNSLRTLMYPVTIGYFESDGSYLINRANVPSLLLIHTACGSGSLSYNGAEYLLSPNTVALFDCNIPHLYKTVDEPWKFDWVHFAGANAFDFFGLVYGSAGAVTNANETLSRTLKDIFQFPKLEMPVQHIEVLFHKHITDAMCEMMLLSGKNQPLKISKSMRDVIAYIEGHYKESIKVDTLAEIACMSKYHFIRKFKECFADSPYEYVLKYRLEKAKALLLNSDLKLDTVAGETGFSNASHLIVFFKKCYNCSPYAYKSMLRNFYPKN